MIILGERDVKFSYRKGDIVQTITGLDPYRVVEVWRNENKILTYNDRLGIHRVFDMRTEYYEIVLIGHGDYYFPVDNSKMQIDIKTLAPNKNKINTKNAK